MLRSISFFAGLIKPRLCPKVILNQVRHCAALPKIASDGLSLADPGVQKYLENARVEFYGLKVGENLSKDQIQRMRMLSGIVELVEQRGVLLKNIKSLNDMKDEKDEEMMALVKEERQVYSELLSKLETQIIDSLFDMDDTDDYDALMLEIAAGVGGQEAMLFASELFQMYSNFCLYKGWDCEELQFDASDTGGCRHASLLVSGRDAFRALRLEGGVHRVQRVPATEKSGRIHTSTVTVAIIPRLDDIEIDIQEKDLKIETKRASGAGGQHVNTCDSAVRIVHLPTGIAVENQTERNQHANKKKALARLKGILLQTHMQKQATETMSTRKNQDRITDHRIEGGTVHNLKGFLHGGNELDTLNSRVSANLRRRNLLEIIKNMK